MAESRDSYVLRPYTPLDYDRYDKMWNREKDQETPPPMSIPENGLVVGDFKAVGFLANVDCDFGFACWYMVDDSLSDKDKYWALMVLFSGLEDLARDLEKNYIFCFTQKSSMLKMLERIGYLQMGQGHLGKRIA